MRQEGFDWLIGRGADWPGPIALQFLNRLTLFQASQHFIPYIHFI